MPSEANARELVACVREQREIEHEVQELAASFKSAQRAGNSSRLGTLDRKRRLLMARQKRLLQRIAALKAGETGSGAAG